MSSLCSARNMSPVVNVATQPASKYAIQIITTHFPPLAFLNGANRTKKDWTKKLGIINPLIFHVSHTLWTFSDLSNTIFFTNLFCLAKACPTLLYAQLQYEI
ncbi:hypothetical protein SLE2022_319790 [Rubroshorea leprosula]